MASILTEWFVPHSPLREERKVGVVIDSASGLKALEWAQKYLVLSQPNDKFFIIGVKPRNNTTENDRGMEAIDQEEDEQAHDQATSKGRWENVKSKAFVFKEICVTKVYRKDNTDLATLRQAITDFGLNVLVVGRQTVLGIITELMEEPTCTIVVVKDDTPARDEENGKEKLLRSSSKKRKGSDDPTPVASTSKINS